MNFSKFISSYENPNAKRVNENIIYNMRNEDLVEYIIDAYKSLEVIKHIKLLDYQLIEDESKFDSGMINKNHLKGKIEKDLKRYIFIDYSRFSLLRTRFKISFKGEIRVHTIDLLIPKKYKKYYMIIGGNKFYPIYQLVDSSTYNNNDYVTQKTMFMPIIIKRNTPNLEDVEKNIFKVPYYSLYLFKKKCNPLLYYLATMGYTNTMRYMGMEDIISVDTVCDNNEEYYYFKKNQNLYVKVIKYFFDNDYFTQSMVYSLIDAIPNKVTIDYLHDINNWCIKLGSYFTTNPNSQLDKGKNVILSFYRLLDNTTRKSLKLKQFNKENIYSIVRWMMRNFSELKAKDNMDLANKRIRMAEYIAFFFNKKLSTKANSLLSRKSYTIEDIEDVIKIAPDELLKQLNKSKTPLLRYDNTVNDLDMFTALKFSSKGPGAIGENNKNAISIKYRGVHPSHVGRIDLNTSGTSDPGMGGVLVPFIKTYGFYFDPKPEPQTWDENMDKMKKNYFKQDNIPIKSLDYFYRNENKTRKFLRKLEDVYHFIEHDSYHNDLESVIQLDDKMNIDKVLRVKDSDVKEESKPELRKVKFRKIE